MSGTKIVVFHLKEIIKTAVFAIIGVILIILLIYFIAPKKSNDNLNNKIQYNPGTYSSVLTLHNDAPLTVLVTVSEDQITEIALEEFDSSVDVFYPLLVPTMETISAKIINTQSLDVLTPEDNKITSEVLMYAIRTALDEAAIK